MPLEDSLALIDQLPTLIWHSGPDGLCDYLNQSWLRFTGRTLAQSVGQGWFESVHPDDLPGLLESFRSSVRNRCPFETEYRLRRHDDVYRWMFWVATPLFADEGQYSGHLANCVDLTERKQAEDAVQRQLALLGHARDAMLLLDPAGMIRDANQAAESMYGYPRAELLARSVADLRAPKMHTSPSFELERAWQDGHLFEAVHVRKDGSEFEAEVNSQAADVNGERMLVSIVRDVTERRSMERQLRTSESRYRSLFENMREGVAIHELVHVDGAVADYRILDVNNAYIAHTGIPRHAVIGRLGTEVYGTPIPPYLEHYRRVVVSGSPASFETYFAPLNRHLVISAFPMGGMQFGTIFTDVTERKRVEEQFRQSQKMEAVGRLAGGIAHDFNNLLTIILAYTDMLLDAVGDGPMRDGIMSINEAGERAAKLTS
ncbi:MAG TPA: PAS domain S-box protein, partial [Bryobacteraceae bacterium]